jgi:hypothetical protein
VPIIVPARDVTFIPKPKEQWSKDDDPEKKIAEKSHANSSGIKPESPE